MYTVTDTLRCTVSPGGGEPVSRQRSAVRTARSRATVLRRAAMKPVLVLAVLLGLVACGHALDCYTCRGKSVDVGDVGGMVSGSAKPCSEFRETNEFKTTCTGDYTMSCLKVTRDTDVIRGCAKIDKNACEDDGKLCYCKDNMCNSSNRGWPSAVLLLAALTAALLGWRH